MFATFSLNIGRVVVDKIGGNAVRLMLANELVARAIVMSNDESANLAGQLYDMLVNMDEDACARVALESKRGMRSLAFDLKNPDTVNLRWDDPDMQVHRTLSSYDAFALADALYAAARVEYQPMCAA